ncbi:serendipity locus protein alpha [Anabrus simplex]|uniref:serendipity locus protein alpha n=1 Tax=Anabrus simplex TaxID=316456 RepID=UPI0035A2BA10
MMDIRDLKTKSMVKVVQPLADQVLQCSSSSRNRSNGELPHNDVLYKIKETCITLLQSVGHDVQCSTKLRTALDEYCSAVDDWQIENKCNENSIQVFKNLLLAVHDVAVKKDFLEIEKISISIKECQDSLVKVVEASNSEEIMMNLKQFGMLTSACMAEIGARASDLLSKKQQHVILLCASQIAKCLHWLRIALIGKVEDMQLLKRYIFSCINWCFSELNTVINAPRPSTKEESEGCGGQFVHKMDLALEILTSCSGKLPEVELKSVIDDVLCHAMSIAQVAVASDCEVITASCQKVLRALEVLKKEYQNSCGNPSVRNLYVNGLADSLEGLEQRVNTALLRLVLEVFCDFNQPLNNLLNFVSNNSIPEGIRQVQDLSEMVAVFDLQMDRIMQIGLFAMACSEDIKRVLGIRSCLASLESLEPELVPAVTAYYLEPNKVACIIYLKTLWLHWKNEVDKLAKLIDGIVDPAAFCQVTLDDIQVLVAKMKAQVHKRDVLYLRKITTAVCNRARKLLQHLKISIADVDQQNIPSALPKIMDDFHLVCRECHAVRRVVLLGSDDPVNSTAYLKLLKRFELLVSVVKKLQPLLVEMMSNSLKEYGNISFKNDDITNKTVEEILRFPESVNDLPVDEDSCSSATSEHNSTDHFAPGEIINELLKRGKLLSKERSILYFTPKNKEHFHSNMRQASIHRTHRRPVNPRSNSVEVQTDSVIDQTLCLEITRILDKLTFLSDTLSETTEGVKDMKDKINVGEAELNPSDNTCLLNEEDTHNTFFNSPAEPEAFSGNGNSIISYESSYKKTLSALSIASLTSHEVNTPERIQDLQAVQNRIELLLKEHPGSSNSQNL